MCGMFCSTSCSILRRQSTRSWIQAISAPRFFIRSASQSSNRKPAPAADFIPPKSSLFVSGAASMYASFFTDPFLDFTAQFQDLYLLKHELTARNLTFDVENLSSSWTEIRELRMEKAKIEKYRKRLAVDNASKGEITEDTKLRGRLIREKLETVEKQLRSRESDVVLTLLQLPTTLHKSTPRGEEPVVLFTSANEHLDADADVGQILFELFVEFSDVAPNGYYLRGPAAELESQLNTLGQKFLTTMGCEEMSGLNLLKAVVLEGAGDRVQDASEAFMIYDEDSYSSEFRSLFLNNHPLSSFAGYLGNSDIKESILPLRLQSSGRIYRPQPAREGRQRLFYPIQSQTVNFCLGCRDSAETDDLMKKAVLDLQILYVKLNLPFKISVRPAKELAINESIRVAFDLWSPSQRKYIPCGYISAHNDFVSKRLRCHVEKPDKNRFLHLISGCVMSLAPLVACSMENSACRVQKKIVDDTEVSKL